MSLPKLCQELIGYIDLTSLNADDTQQAIEDLCHQAQTSLGSVAAVCVYPVFVSQAKSVLKDSVVKVATVANFPSGQETPEQVVSIIKQALNDGADEIDVVFPYQSFLQGDTNYCHDFLKKCRQAIGSQTMKVILETGAYPDALKIKQAAEIAVAEGADFLKTSTGKIPVGATQEAAEILLQTILDSGKSIGFKASGGVRSFEDACLYRNLVEKICGQAGLTPARFRLGASQLLSNLLSVAGQATKVYSEKQSNY